MNPMKTNRANPEIDAKQRAKAYLIEPPTEPTNRGKKTTERRLRLTKNQAMDPLLRTPDQV